MERRFTIASETEPELLDWGRLRWLCNPPSTGAKDLTVIDVTLSPGKGHNFHKHPDQEEVILCVSGSVEQWVDREKRILGPCVGEIGYELVDVAGEAPWKTLRG